MFGGDRDDETICAVSTPPGRGGVAVIRVSGSNAGKITQLLAPFLPLDKESHKVYFGTLVDPSSQEAIDEVLVTYFKKGRSYTGEETLEISCHGNPAITADVLRVLFEAGAKHAGPGEFTYRAFLNGNIDLIQAENVLSLIEGKTDKQRKVALRNLKGDLSKQVAKVEDSLIYVLAQLEASIDFIEDDIEIFEVGDLASRLDSAELQVKLLVDSFKSGRLLSEGLEVAILGPTNAGKSSLLNQLIKEDRAIVTEVPGTTRDVVTAEIAVKGCLVRFSDTAGIRETLDPVERIGIDRSLKVAEQADFIFYVYDANLGLSEDETRLIRIMAKKAPVVCLANKIDLIDQSMQNVTSLTPLADIEAELFGLGAGSVKEQSLGPLALGYLGQFLGSELDAEMTLVTRPRQYELVCEALDALVEGRTILLEKMSPDLVSSKLKQALLAIQEFEGKEFDDDILDRIFSDFCIGK